MTICIAAMAENRYIVCACDHLLTRHNRDRSSQAESPNSKIEILLPYAAVSTAGSTTVHNAAIERVYVSLDRSINHRIADVAHLYSRAIAEEKRLHFERAILQQHGLSLSQWDRRSDIDPLVVKAITVAQEDLDISRFNSKAILAGIDELGPHIFEVDYRSSETCDSDGYSAIGSAENYITESFDAAGFVSRSPLADVLFWVFVSKKRAEADPHAGRRTEIQIIDAQRLELRKIPPDGMLVLESIYEDWGRQMNAAAASARSRFADFIEHSDMPIRGLVE